MRTSSPRVALFVALSLASCSPAGGIEDAAPDAPRDSTSPPRDALTPTPDGDEPDGDVPDSDAPDAEAPAMDATAPTPDVPSSQPDAATPPRDVVAPPRDVATPPTDAPPADAPPTMPGRITTTTPAPGDPAMRSQADVCALWNDVTQRARTAPAFTPGSGMCAPGTLPQATRDAAVLMTNAYRWLAGLPNVAENTDYSSAAQACAELMQANNMLSHTPPTSWTCYTALGAMGAGRSNITSGGSSPVSSLAGWVDDQRDLTMTLGHRRWVLFPPLGPIGYGQSQRYACQYILGTRGTATKPWVAWPNEGVTPMESSTPLWSFSSARMGVTASTRAAVTANGMPVSVSAALRANGYGDPTISWMMPALTAGTVYRVTITGLTGDATVNYEVRPVRCAM